MLMQGHPRAVETVESILSQAPYKLIHCINNRLALIGDVTTPKEH